LRNPRQFRNRLRFPAVIVLNVHGGLRGQQQLGALHVRNTRCKIQPFSFNTYVARHNRFENSFSPAITTIAAVQRMWHVLACDDLHFVKFNEFLLKFKSRDLGACLCHVANVARFILLKQ